MVGNECLFVDGFKFNNHITQSRNNPPSIEVGVGL